MFGKAFLVAVAKQFESCQMLMIERRGTADG
jgi:hypothetical protein